MSAQQILAGCVFAALACGVASATSNNYSDPKTWLCRPGGHDACDVDLTTTVIAAKPWTNPVQNIETPWVSLPGLITGRCTTNENAGFLEITLHGDPAGKRTSDITGDIMAGSQVVANWGLHLIDVNLTMGDLVELVGRQAKAYAARAR